MAIRPVIREKFEEQILKEQSFLNARVEELKPHMGSELAKAYAAYLYSPEKTIVEKRSAFVKILATYLSSGEVELITQAVYAQQLYIDESREHSHRTRGIASVILKLVSRRRLGASYMLELPMSSSKVGTGSLQFQNLNLLFLSTYQIQERQDLFVKEISWVGL